ncbi:MAG: hypothetical protein JO007_21150 [Alphaproteobacteria bacterium]|nr:hypothetical protein [Alphaproteobacteria bacterium]
MNEGPVHLTRLTVHQVLDRHSAWDRYKGKKKLVVTDRVIFMAFPLRVFEEDD